MDVLFLNKISYKHLSHTGPPQTERPIRAGAKVAKPAVYMSVYKKFIFNCSRLWRDLHAKSSVLRSVWKDVYCAAGLNYIPMLSRQGNLLDEDGLAHCV